MYQTILNMILSIKRRYLANKYHSSFQLHQIESDCLEHCIKMEMNQGKWEILISLISDVFHR